MSDSVLLGFIWHFDKILWENASEPAINIFLLSFIGVLGCLFKIDCLALLPFVNVAAVQPFPSRYISGYFFQSIGPSIGEP